LTTLTNGDLATISGGISLHDGNRGRTLTNAKLNSLQLIITGKRGPLGWTMNFMGAGAPTTFTAAGVLLTNSPVPNWWVSHGSGIPDFIRFTLNMNFNLVTNEEIGSSVSQYGSEVNAGNPVFTGSILLNTPRVSELVDDQSFTLVIQTSTTPTTVTIRFERPVWHLDSDTVAIGRPFSQVEVPCTFRRKADGSTPISFS